MRRMLTRRSDFACFHIQPPTGKQLYNSDVRLPTHSQIGTEARVETYPPREQSARHRWQSYYNRDSIRSEGDNNPRWVQRLAQGASPYSEYRQRGTADHFTGRECEHQHHAESAADC